MEKKTRRLHLSKKMGLLLLICFVVVLLFGASVTARSWCNTHAVVVKDNFYSQDLPSSFYGFRIMCIADFWNSWHSSEIASIINEEKPDVVVFIGNMIRGTQGDDNLVELMAAIDADVDVDVYGVFGSQEILSRNQEPLLRMLEENGIHCLINEKVTFTRGQDSIELIGVNEVMDVELDASESMKQTRQYLKSAIDPNVFTLVVARRTTMYPYLCDLPAALMFSAYNKECEFRMAEDGSVVKADEGFFPDYEEGFYGEGEMDLYVAKGSNAKSNGLFSFHRPAVTIITLKR